MIEGQNQDSGYQRAYRSHQEVHEIVRGVSQGFLLILMLSFIATGGIVYIALIEEVPSVFIAFVVFWGLAMAVAALPRQTASERVVHLRLVATVYFASVIVVIIVYYILQFQYDMPYLGIGGSDDLTYEMRAQKAAQLVGISNYWHFRDVLSAKYAGYYYLVAVLQTLGNALGGYHTLLPRLLNSFCLSVIAVLVYEMSKMCYLSRKVSLGGAYLIGVFPLLAFFAATVLRDITVVLLILLVVYLTIKLVHARKLLELVSIVAVGIGVLAVMWSFRRLSVLACIFAVVTILIGRLGWHHKTSSGFALILFALLAVFVLVGLLSLNLWMPELVQSIEKIDYYPDRFELTDSSLSQYIWTAPKPLSYVLRAAYGLVTPLPVFTTNPLSLYRKLGTMVWILLMPFAFLRVRTVIVDPDRRILFIFWMVFFVGTTQTVFSTRQFVQFYPFALLLAVDGFEYYRRYVWPILWLNFLVFGSASCIYYILKVM